MTQEDRVAFIKERHQDLVRQAEEPLGKTLTEVPVYVALCRAAGKLGKTFSKEELLVACWQGDKERWGLTGFKELFPDAHKFSSFLYGRRGFIKQGYIEPAEGNQFTLTDKGHRIATARAHGFGGAD